MEPPSNLAETPPSQSTSKEACTITTTAAPAVSPALNTPTTTSQTVFVAGTYGHQLIPTVSPSNVLEEAVNMIETIQVDIDTADDTVTEEEIELRDWNEERLEGYWDTITENIYSQLKQNLTCKNCHEGPGENIFHQAPDLLAEKLDELSYIWAWTPDDLLMPLAEYLETITPRLQALEKEYFELVLKNGCRITPADMAKQAAMEILERADFSTCRGREEYIEALKKRLLGKG